MSNKGIFSILFAGLFIIGLCGAAFAQDAAAAEGLKVPVQFAAWSAMAAGLAIGIGAFGCSIGQGTAIAKAMESIGRNPEAHSKIQSTLLIGLAFIESSVLYALVIAFLLWGNK